jgi:hypothetical protein
MQDKEIGKTLEEIPYRAKAKGPIRVENSHVDTITTTEKAVIVGSEIKTLECSSEGSTFNDSTITHLTIKPSGDLKEIAVGGMSVPNDDSKTPPSITLTNTNITTIQFVGRKGVVHLVNSKVTTVINGASPER